MSKLEKYGVGIGALLMFAGIVLVAIGTSELPASEQATAFFLLVKAGVAGIIIGVLAAVVLALLAVLVSKTKREKYAVLWTTCGRPCFIFW